MTYNNRYLLNLFPIINDLNTSKINEALIKFTAYIKDVKGIGSYSPSNWPDSFIDKMYEFGRKFRTIPSSDFLKALEVEINSSSTEEKEVLFFIKSEILFAYEGVNCLKDLIDSLVKDYPTNLEFLHDLGHIQKLQNKLGESIKTYSNIIKEHSREPFLASKFGAELEVVEIMIEKNNLNDAEAYVSEMMKRSENQLNFIRNNWLIVLKSRIKDYGVWEKRLLEIKESTLNKVEKEGARTIELLGVFTAIIVFIFSTVTIEKNFAFSQAIALTICLGLILILFCTILSIFFTESSNKIYKDFRLYVLIIIAFFLYLISVTSPIMVSHIQKILNDTTKTK